MSSMAVTKVQTYHYEFTDLEKVNRTFDVHQIDFDQFVCKLHHNSQIDLAPIELKLHIKIKGDQDSKTRIVNDLSVIHFRRIVSDIAQRFPTTLLTTLLICSKGIFEIKEHKEISERKKYYTAIKDLIILAENKPAAERHSAETHAEGKGILDQ